jgi:formamidopyrimidine-DNA glycosylase
MPELPELEVMREFLAPRVVGASIAAAAVRRPIVVRNLMGGDVADYLVGRQFVDVARRGKFLLLALDDGTWLVVNPMLAGRLRYGEPLGRHRARDVLVLGLADGCELRYHDAKDMGKVYLARELDQIPTFADQGPEATAADLTLEVWRQRLRPYRGEIKWILTKQAFVAGIGNAYADEICWRAGIYPFRRRPRLNGEEVARLYAATRTVLAEAIERLRAHLEREGDLEAVAHVRELMAVHGKAGEPCPRCGTAVSEVKRERRATHFCRTCQPGLMVNR